LRRFLAHLARFSALPAAVLLLGELALVGSGEAWSVDRVVDYQRTHADSRFLRALDQAFYAYKYRGIAERRPRILVLGSSRTMKFRAGMFGDRAESFFNGGGMVNSLNDLTAFTFTRPPPEPPALVIIGVDLWWLNDRIEPGFRFEDEIAHTGAWTFDQHVIGLRWLLNRPSTFVRTVATVAARDKRDAIGIAARESGGGFRPDGSFKVRLRIPQNEAEWAFVDREDPPIIERVRTGTGNFVPVDRVSPARLAALAAVLDAYRDRGAIVIGYLPPFSSAVAAVLRSDRRYSSFFAEFRRAVATLFAERGFPTVDASDVPALDMDDRALSDGFHGEETLHARVVLRMLADARVSRLLPGARSALDRALASPRTNHWQVDITP